MDVTKVHPCLKHAPAVGNSLLKHGDRLFELALLHQHDPQVVRGIGAIRIFRQDVLLLPDEYFRILWLFHGMYPVFGGWLYVAGCSIE